jgi:hypothetical protein
MHPKRLVAAGAGFALSNDRFQKAPSAGAPSFEVLDTGRTDSGHDGVRNAR